MKTESDDHIMIAASLTADEIAVRDLAIEFFSGRASLDSQHQAAQRVGQGDGAPDMARALCKEMADLGFFSQAVPEPQGGLGLAPKVSALIAEAAGSELVPGLWLDQLVASILLSDAGPTVLAPVLNAEHIVSVGFDAPQPVLRWDETAGTLSGRISGLRFGASSDRWVIVSGDHINVIDPSTAVTDDDADIDALSMSATARLEATVPLHRSELPRGREQALAVAGGLVAAFSIGASARCLDIAVEYVGSREQFGRPIGSFQAIKHRAANAWAALLHARSTVELAAGGGWSSGATEARIAADSCYRSIAESALQMHGGIGFTSEVPIHLFVKNSQRLRGWPRPVDEALDSVRADLGLDTPQEHQR
jgi:alkylation response protein AidB-like acyl-CoA dehydrogenase